MRDNIFIYGRGVVVPRLNSDHSRISLFDGSGLVVGAVPLLPALTLEVRADKTINKIVDEHFQGAPWNFVAK